MPIKRPGGIPVHHQKDRSGTPFIDKVLPDSAGRKEMRAPRIQPPPACRTAGGWTGLGHAGFLFRDMESLIGH